MQSMALTAAMGKMNSISATPSTISTPYSPPFASYSDPTEFYISIYLHTYICLLIIPLHLFVMTEIPSYQRLQRLNHLYAQHTYTFSLTTVPLPFQRQMIASHFVGFLHPSRCLKNRPRLGLHSIKMGARDRSDTLDRSAPTPALPGLSSHSPHAS